MNSMFVKYFTLLSLLIPLSAFCESGFIYKGDLNGDGIIDSIESGPAELFGNAGGPCVLSVSVGDKYKKSIIQCRFQGMVLEVTNNPHQPNRLWSYWRFTAGEGVLTSIWLDGSFETETLVIYANTDIGQHVIKILTLGKSLEFKRINNYQPPETPCGVQWGKGC